MSAHETHPNSRKVYVGPYKVPVREITLSGGEPPMQVYDSSGPQGHDVRDGLPPLRREWIASRGDVQSVPRTYIPDSKRRAELPKTLFRAVLRGKENVTQLHYARKGVITPEWSSSPRAKDSTPSSCARKWRAARHHPGQYHHPELEPMIIGRNFLVKINANIGNSR